MVQYNKNIKNKKKGFTLVELMVVLAITAILAVLVGGGLIAYTRLARFEKNEANARTLFQTAQISLTRMETAGELDAFRRQVMEEGSTGRPLPERRHRDRRGRQYPCEPHQDRTEPERGRALL